MAQEIQEMVVRVKPEGVEETEEALESEAETFEETADTAEAEAGNLENFSRQWQGAMTVITGALAIAAGGLASQMPIVNDLMDGLMSVVESTALALDDDLRPSLQNVVDDLFDLSEAIGQEDGEGVLAALGNLNDSLQEFEDAQIELTVDLLIAAASIDWGEGGLAGAMVRWFQSRSLTDFMPAGFAVQVGERFATRVIEGMAGEFPGAIPIIRENADDWLAEIADFADQLAADINEYGADWIAQFQLQLGRWRDALDTWIANAQANYQAFWTNLAITTVEGANNVISRLESFINKYIRAYNRVASKVGAGTIGTVSMGHFSTGGLRENLSTIESQRQESVSAIENRGEQRRRNVFADREEMVIRFEPARFREFVESELSDGPANRGRSSGVR